MKTVSTVSTLPDLADAFAEAWDQAVVELREPPDFATVFFSEEYEIDPIAIDRRIARVRELTPLVGGCAGGVIGRSREIEESPAVSVFAASGHGVHASTFALSQTALPLLESPDLFRSHLGIEKTSPEVILLFADPHTIEIPVVLEILHHAFPDTLVVGGLIGGAVVPGTATLLASDGTHDLGAVGMALFGVHAEGIVAQGCRPIGEPQVVTRARSNLIYELGRRPAFEVLRETVEALDPSERASLSHSLHIGRVINEYAEEFHTGDFLVRNVLGADPDKGIIGVGDVVNSGQTIQFHVRDGATAEREMRRILRSRAGALRLCIENGGGCLMFNCASRGIELFGSPDHDVTLLRSELGDHPVGGCFCSGEIGPAGRGSAVHAFSSVVLALCEA